MSVLSSMMTTLGRGLVTTSLVGLAIVTSATPGGAQGTSPGAPAPAPSAGEKPAASEGDTQVLRERVAAFWAARLAGDPKAQWELLEPRGRGRLSIQEYTSDRGAVRFVAYQVEDATVTGYFALVKVRVMFQPILPSARRIGIQTILAEDRWVKVRGVWYRQLEEEDQARPQERQS
jgi:hypothetical protein